MDKGKGREERDAVIFEASVNPSQENGTNPASHENKERLLSLQEDREEINQGIERKLFSLKEQEREMLSNLYKTEIEKQVLLNARNLIDERLRKVQHQQYLARAAKVGKKSSDEEKS